MHVRRVVLALPPRVALSTVRFTPELPPQLAEALRTTPTWMATAAKAGYAYPRAFWREAGHTGNAWVTHAQAMLAELFDACSAEGGAALAGFSALGAAQRESFSRGREMLLESQVTQLFGPEAANPQLFWHDWATEPETCSPLDLAEDGAQGHATHGDPLLARPLWDERLYFGGSETARHSAGYLEGALGAAARLRGQLLAHAPLKAVT